MGVFGTTLSSKTVWRKLMNERLILASGSPRRANLLRQIGLTFDIVRPDIDETITIGESAYDYATRMSESKMARSRELIGSSSDRVILCADTIVILDGDIIGKPTCRDDAVSILQRMSNRNHQVLSSVTLCETSSERQRSFMVETQVTFRALTMQECNVYWETGEPTDKSGSYGIQGLGSIFVSGINGSPSNVAGLPLMETAGQLKSFGVDCLAIG